MAPVASAAPPDAGVDAPDPGPAVPEECASEDRYCFPPDGFVGALCTDKYPGVALIMFQKNAPWKHAFVKVRDTMAKNSFGGPVGDARLTFGEEVLLLKYRPYVPTTKLQVSGYDSYDALRLDGTCVTLAEDEFRLHGPRDPHYASVIWKYLEPGAREALAEDDRVVRAGEAQTKKCRGMYLGGGDEACRRATQKLGRAIARALDHGVEMPLPDKLPDWSPDAG